MAAGFRELSMTYGWCVTKEDEAAIQHLTLDIKPHLSYLPAFEVERVLHALKTAYHAHLGQRRRSGEPFVIHPVAVMKILAGYRVDADTLVAGLLHDTVEDTRLSMDDLVKVYGPTVGKLVEGETKVSKLPRRAEAFGHSDEQATNLCHLILAVCEDWRVLVIKLADRLHNMRTIKSMPEHKQARTACETMEVFVPLAEILGVQLVKEELEDLSFQILDRERYEAVQEMIPKQKALLESKQIDGSSLSLQQALFEHVPNRIQGELGIPVHVRLETKPLYQISRTGRLEDVSLETGLFKVTVVLGSGSESGQTLQPVQATSACYHTHQVLTEVLNSGRRMEVTDYFETPRDGYQALHAAIDLGAGIKLEVQVRSDGMERVAKYGSVLASWCHQGVTADGRPPLELPFLQDLQAQTQAMVDNPDRMSMRNLLKSLQTQLAMRRLVFTSEGEILSLDASRGTVTARDAALAQVKGHKLSGFESVQVNGRPVPLSSPLHNGDRVDVLTTKLYGPRFADNTYSTSRTKSSRSSSGSSWIPSKVKESSLTPAIWPLSLLGDDDGEREWLKETESRHGRLAVAYLLAGLLRPVLDQASLLGGGWEDWTWLDVVVPIISLVGAVEIAYTMEKTQGERSSMMPLGQQVNTVGSALGLSAIAGQLATLLRAWESLERGSGRSAMVVVAVMVLQQVWQALFPVIPMTIR